MNSNYFSIIEHENEHSQCYISSSIQTISLLYCIFGVLSFYFSVVTIRSWNWNIGRDVSPWLIFILSCDIASRSFLVNKPWWWNVWKDLSSSISQRLLKFFLIPCNIACIQVRGNTCSSKSLISAFMLPCSVKTCSDTTFGHSCCWLGYDLGEMADGQLMNQDWYLWKLNRC